MALINCPECSNEVSDKANRCPHCGYALKKDLKTKDSLSLNENKIIIILGVSAILVGIIICIIVTFKHNQEKNYLEYYYYNKMYSNDSYSSSSQTSKDASSIFRNLEISDFYTSKSKHWYNMSCKVKNNNSFTVYGYFRVNFYDRNGNLMYNQLMSLPDVASGENVVCSTMISIDDFPIDYTSVDFSQSSLCESKK